MGTVKLLVVLLLTGSVAFSQYYPANSAAGAHTRTDVQNFILAGASGTGSVAFATGSTAGATYYNQTGPGSVGGFSIGTLSNYTNGNAVMVSTLASPTWSAAAGTVDFSMLVVGTGNTAGTVTYTGYLGCLAPGAAPQSASYGTGSAQTVSVAATAGYTSLVSFNAIALPASNCAANAELQFWVVKTSDPSGAYPNQVSIRTIIRGN